MRILRSLSVIALAVAGQTVGAQLVVNSLPPARFGLTGGMNLSTFDGDGLGPTANRRGFVGGGVLVTPFAPDFSTQLELLYSMKGMKSLASNRTDYAMFKLNYLEIPVMLRGDLPLSSAVVPFAFTGPAVDFKLSCSSDEVVSGNVSNSFDCDQLPGLKLRTVDVGWVLGGGLGFDYHNRRISLGARYEVGLRTITDEGSSKNRALSFMASVEAPLPRRSPRE